jgi:hypothetical protein
VPFNVKRPPVVAQPSLPSPCLNTRARSSPFGSFSLTKATKPIRTTRLARCARATPGHAAAASPAMNSRRFICETPSDRSGKLTAVPIEMETGSPG